MSAETLRQAASLMRERAEAATAGPWSYSETEIDHGHLYWVHAEPRSYTSDVAEVIATEGDAEHIASWPPAVALAVAAWLEGQARFCLNGTGLLDHCALAVARAYLGESA